MDSPDAASLTFVPELDHLNLSETDRNLIAQACADATKVFLAPLDKGLSGSAVWLARWRLKNGLSSKFHVFKIGERRKLEKEYAAVKRYLAVIERRLPAFDLYYHRSGRALLRQEFFGNVAGTSQSLRQFLHSCVHCVGTGRWEGRSAAQPSLRERGSDQKGADGPDGDEPSQRIAHPRGALASDYPRADVDRADPEQRADRATVKQQDRQGHPDVLVPAQPTHELGWPAVVLNDGDGVEDAVLEANLTQGAVILQEGKYPPALPARRHRVADEDLRPGYDPSCPEKDPSAFKTRKCERIAGHRVTSRG